MDLFYSPRCLAYHAAGHPERPDRLRSITAALQHPNHAARHTWHEPQPGQDADLLRVHSPAHLAAVASGDYYDGDTPHFPNSDALARLASGAAIGAAETAAAGSPSFSLMRPPGHHAEQNRIMGFCYYNHLAVAVARLLDTGPIDRIAIFDFDCHHGNGTENIFRDHSQVLFVSLHQSPCYPGTGLRSAGNCHNYPLPPGTGPAEYLAACDRALAVVTAFKPQLVAVSAGFDAYWRDPITDMRLDIDTFGEIGRRIRTLGQPAFAVLEGGYAEDLGDCVAAFIAGWEPPAGATTPSPPPTSD